MKIWIVYEHISLSGRIYVGITSQGANCRWQNGRGYYKCKLFYKAIRKYGWDNFQHNIIASNLGEMTAKNMEKDLIKFYKEQDKSYNITNGGDGTVGVQCSPIIKEKIGDLWRGKTIPSTVRIKMSKSHIGHKNTEEHNTNISKSKLGNTNGNKPVLQFDKNGNFITRFSSAVEAARCIATIPNSVTRCCRGEAKTLHGFIFKYESNLLKL